MEGGFPWLTVLLALAAVVALTAVGLGLTYMYLRSRANSRRTKARKRVSDLVVLVGPYGAGKTAVAYKLLTGTRPMTVATLKPHTVKGSLASVRARAPGVDAPTLQVSDVPPHPYANTHMLSEVSVSAATVLLLPYASEAPSSGSHTRTHTRAAADILYDLFTTPACVDAAPAMCICLNKCEGLSKEARARALEDARVALEKELERLKVARPAVATEGEEAAEGASSALRPGTLLLGAQDHAFTFAKDAPFPVSFICSHTCGGVEPGAESGLEELEAFISDATHK